MEELKELKELKEYVDFMKRKFAFQEVEAVLRSFEHLNVLVIGDTIIDTYTFVVRKGRASKDPIMSVEYQHEENYPGGILAVANHLSTFVKSIKLVTMIGDTNSMINFISSSLNPNIQLKTFVKENAPTTIKKRIIESYRLNKLFKIEYIKENPITETLTQEILTFLDEELPKYDLVVVADYGHGFINNEIRRKLEEKSKFLAINVQSNSSNMGYNYFNLYNHSHFITMNETEIRLPLSMRFEDIQTVITEAHSRFKISHFLLTLGKNGCILFTKGSLLKAPVLISSVKDTVGSGDALFGIASLCAVSKVDNELLPFLANCAGGIAANTMGNKESITKSKLITFARGVYEHGMGRL